MAVGLFLCLVPPTPGQDGSYPANLWPGSLTRPRLARQRHAEATLDKTQGAREERCWWAERGPDDRGGGGG